MAMALHLLLHYRFATVLGIAKLHIKSHNASNITAGALIARHSRAPRPHKCYQNEFRNHTESQVDCKNVAARAMASNKHLGKCAKCATPFFRPFPFLRVPLFGDAAAAANDGDDDTTVARITGATPVSLPNNTINRNIYI